MLAKQLRTVFEIDVHDEAVGFGRLVRGDAGQEFAAQLQCRAPIGGTLDDIGQGQTKLPHAIKVEHSHGCLPGTHPTLASAI
jgi:hypothetical protein